MTAPLLISFDVDCPADHAFDVWTSKIGTWWPRDHTVSGNPEEIVLENGLGGRITSGHRPGSGTSGARSPPGNRPAACPTCGTSGVTAARRRRSRSPSSTKGRHAPASRSRTAGGTSWAKKQRPGGTRTAVVGMRWCRTSWQRWGMRGLTDGDRNEGDPWVLKTAPGSSEYTMYQDEESEPALLVCQVGSTKLTYDLRAIDDLHRWLSEQGDWVPLGAADEKKAAADGTVEAWGRCREPGRRLVRPAQGVPGALRHVPPAPARGARPGRAHPRGAEQQHARPLNGPIAARRRTAP